MSESQPTGPALTTRIALIALPFLFWGCRPTPTVHSAIRPPAVVAAPRSHSPAAPTVGIAPRPVLFETTRHVPHKVALTFDAGADDRAVTLLLKTLHDHHVHATFFLTGKFCERYPNSCRAIAEAGMEIGNHSYSHPHFTKLTRAAILQQLDRADAAIRHACGRSTKPLFRFPYGDCDRRTLHIVAEAGYQPIGWTVDSLDSVGKPKSPKFVADRINNRIRSGDITLCHVSMVRSAQALPAIFAHLDHRGDRVVPIGELLTEARAAQKPIKLVAGRQTLPSRTLSHDRRHKNQPNSWHNPEEPIGHGSA